MITGVRFRVLLWVRSRVRLRRRPRLGSRMLLWRRSGFGSRLRGRARFLRWFRFWRSVRLLRWSGFWPRLVLGMSRSRFSFRSRLHGVSRPWLSSVWLWLRVWPWLHCIIWPRFSRFRFARPRFRRICRSRLHSIDRARTICHHWAHHRSRCNSVVRGNWFRSYKRLRLATIYCRELRAVGRRLAL